MEWEEKNNDYFIYFILFVGVASKPIKKKKNIFMQFDKLTRLKIIFNLCINLKKNNILYHLC